MIYNMVATTDNTILYNWNLVREMFSQKNREICEMMKVLINSVVGIIYIQRGRERERDNITLHTLNILQFYLSSIPQ